VLCVGCEIFRGENDGVAGEPVAKGVERYPVLAFSGHGAAGMGGVLAVDFGAIGGFGRIHENNFGCFCTGKRKRVPDDVLFEADRLECQFLEGYDPGFGGGDPPVCERRFDDMDRNHAFDNQMVGSECEGDLSPGIGPKLTSASRRIPICVWLPQVSSAIAGHWPIYRSRSALERRFRPSGDPLGGAGG
ncbi:MAG TPA: hypothetical protein VI756_19725, partial [Blastocatellia bacterium]